MRHLVISFISEGPNGGLQSSIFDFKYDSMPSFKKILEDFYKKSPASRNATVMSIMEFSPEDMKALGVYKDNPVKK